MKLIVFYTKSYFLLLLINIFPIIFIFFLFYKVKGINRHPLYNPRLSKYFLKTKLKLATLNFAQTVNFISKKSRRS